MALAIRLQPPSQSSATPRSAFPTLLLVAGSAPSSSAILMLVPFRKAAAVVVSGLMPKSLPRIELLLPPRT